jgi:hypothetical protein
MTRRLRTCGTSSTGARAVVSHLFLLEVAALFVRTGTDGRRCAEGYREFEFLPWPIAGPSNAVPVGGRVRMKPSSA